MTVALITNDDGIASPGLFELARAVADGGWDIVIAAPADEASGSSAAITGTAFVAVTGATDRSRIRVEKRELPEVPGAPAFAVHAAPGLVALLAAHGAFGAVPDVVLSGINRGANIGRAILHSGTVGAALTAGVNGQRALAVSLDVGLHPDAHHWATAAVKVREVMPILLAHPAGSVFNLNVPNVPPGTHLDLREATLAPFGIVQTTVTEQGEGDMRLTVREVADSPAPGTDAALLSEGHATITKIVAITEADDRVFTAGI